MLTCKKTIIMLTGLVLISPPLTYTQLFLKTKWGRLDNQMRYFGSIKHFVSSMSLVNICVVYLAPVDSLIGVLGRKVFISANKPHDALK